MKKIYSVVIVFLSIFSVNSQNTPDVYSIYEKQYSDLLSSRGVNDNDIKEILRRYAGSNINSDADFASLLAMMYSGNRDIGLLFYFFNNDTLRRAYFKPGELLEIKSIPIRKDELMQLGADIYQSLNLYALSNDRTPIPRGGSTVSLEKPTSTSFNNIVRHATDILIPRILDTATKHLLIIPALNIGTIPFHLLQPFGDSSPLIEHCSFTIVPSLIDLVGLRTRVLRQKSDWRGSTFDESFDYNYDFRDIDSFAFSLKNRKSLFVANPAYPTDSPFTFPNLPGALREIKSALPYSNNYVLLKGKDATKKNVLKNIGNSDLAYFATHGIADQVDPMGKSFLVLSGESPYLKAKEIMSFMDSGKTLPAMVILSACQTGLGKSLEAGTAGLARSFLLGGSSHVIMSLWNVDDEATAYLMSRFVHHLQSPHRFMPAEPLRLAILDTKKIYKNPSQWASFSLFGIDY